MKNQMKTKLAIRSSIALGLALENVRNSVESSDSRVTHSTTPFSV